MKKSFLSGLIVCLLTLMTQTPILAKNYTLSSPNGKIHLTIDIDEAIRYSVAYEGKQLLAPSTISMQLADGTILGKEPRGTRVQENKYQGHINAVNYRTKGFETAYKELKLRFKGDYGVLFRAYDEGVAYRFFTTFKNDLEILNEQMDLSFDQSYNTYFSYSTNTKEPEAMAFQNLYSIDPLSKPSQPDNLSFLPVTVDYGNELKLTFTEVDLEDYPGMFVHTPQGENSLKASFAKRPVKTMIHPYRCQELVTERSNLIAQTKGTRPFPWRAFAITTKDSDMPTNNLVYALASPSVIEDGSWIKPGKAAWEWWNDWGLCGVDFKAGINMDTYKYYIDFAQKNNLEYVVLDEGWYNPKNGDVMTVIPELDLEELVTYAKERNVRLILWVVANVLDDKLEEACKHYAEMGIAGFKVDFIDRDDQEAVRMVYRLAEMTAKYKLLIDYHGMYKPTGLNRTYPNVINFEAVFGMEEVKWGSNKNDMPAYNVTMPYIRMLAGPVDFTPGAMRNSSKVDFKGIYYSPMSQGTRCHQLAMYIVYDSPLTMLCDAPTAYEKEPECTQFIASIPDEIDETRVLQGKMGEYIVTARRCGNDWYIGGMNNWDARDLSLTFDFLEKGNYRAILIKDGINATKRAEDFAQEHFDIDPNGKLNLTMAPGGGFVIRLEKK